MAESPKWLLAGRIANCTFHTPPYHRWIDIGGTEQPATASDGAPSAERAKGEGRRRIGKESGAPSPDKGDGALNDNPTTARQQGRTVGGVPICLALFLSLFRLFRFLVKNIPRDY